MSEIIEKIKEVENLYHVKGCTTAQLKEAQEELAINFPQEYVDYVKEFGVISFLGTEWTGLSVNGYLNVVEVTKQERALNSSFPSDCFVLENQGIEGLFTICNEKGEVFSIQYDKVQKIQETILEYLEECMNR